MKVLHLTKYCPPYKGGIETFTFDLVKELNNLGVGADILCFNKESKILEFNKFKIFKSKVNFKINTAPISFKYTSFFFKIYKNYDIIHLHSPNPLGELISLFAKKPIVIHWHSDVVRKNFLYIPYRFLQKKVLSKASFVIVTSPNYLKASEILQEFRKKCKVIPLGISFSRLENSATNKLGVEDSILEKVLKENKKIVLSIGRLVEYKGFEYLIKAAKYISNDAIILIIGNGPLYNSLRKLINKYRLNNKVFILTNVEDITPYLKTSYVFCLPSISRAEAFGLVLLEAMYYGKPLITSHIPGSGMVFVNQKGKTGLTVPPKNPKLLAKAINSLLNSPDSYKRYKLNCLKTIKNFDIKSVATQIVQLYEEIIGEQKKNKE